MVKHFPFFVKCFFLSYKIAALWKLSFLDHILIPFFVEDHTDRHDDTGGKDDKKKNSLVKGGKHKPGWDLIKKNNGDEATRNKNHFRKNIGMKKKAEIKKPDKQ